MKPGSIRSFYYFFVFCCLVVAWLGPGLAAGALGQETPSARGARREVAVTFDDLPIQVRSARSCQLDYLNEMTGNLLSNVTAHQVPALGLVVESRLCEELRAQHLSSLLEMWLDAGLELGNHSFSHFNLNNTDPERYQEDILLGERTVRPLLESRGMELRYFRYPQLHAGTELGTKQTIETFLAENGYTNAPVTVDNQEWIFSALYTRAIDRGDTETATRIAEAYIPYMEKMFEYYERLSMEVLGYEIRQILLLHANPLNADYFDALAQMMKRRGYSFISLEQALEDEAYHQPDPYVGPQGLSWMLRWAIGKGVNPPDEPREPEWIAELYRTF